MPLPRIPTLTQESLPASLEGLESPVDRSQWEPREDGSPKGDGFLGALRRPDNGGVMSEYSMSADLKNPDGSWMDFPTLVPTLNEGEVNTILGMKEGDQMPNSIIQKAQDHASRRLSTGQSVFAQPGEQQNIHPQIRRVLAGLTGK